MTLRTGLHCALATAALALAPGWALAQSTIAIEPIGHWHVFDSKTLTFDVTDDEGQGIEGLDLEVRIVSAETGSVRERSVSGGDVSDVGGGTYTLEHTVTSLGAHAMSVAFESEDHASASDPVAFDVSRAGEEGVVAAQDGTAFVYQIRYVWRPGHVHASAAEPATLSFEVMRGLPEGDEIDWERPWSNPFDHVTDARDPVVSIETTDGAVIDRLTPSYAGRGIYEIERLFPVAEVVETGGDYLIRFSFTDPHHGGDVTHAEPYPLHVAEPH